MAFEVYRLAVQGMMLNQEIVNVFHFAKPDGGPDGSPADLVGSWYEDGMAVYLDACPNQYAIQTLTARLVGSASQFEFSVSGSGTRTGTMSAPQICPVVTWTTRFAERSARGRTYLPGITETDAADGIVQANLITAMEGLALAMLAGFGTTATYLFSIHSYTHNTTREVVGYRANTIVRTQRRRTIGVGA